MDERADFTIEAGAVVAGVDGSDTAVHAAIWAAGEARRRGVPLRILHAAPYATDPAAHRRASGIVGHARTAARRRVPEAEVRTALSRLGPRAALAAASAGADLLVLGMIVGATPAEPVLGSLAPALSAASRCPVVVVRGAVPARPRTAPVAVGVQSADEDGAALAVAFADAARHGSPLLVVHAGHEPEADLAAALAPWRAAHPDVVVQHRVRSGTARDALLGAAAEARLLVVGARRRSAAARILLGSTTRDLLRLSPVPVEVVHPEPGPGTVATPEHAAGTGR